MNPIGRCFSSLPCSNECITSNRSLSAIALTIAVVGLIFVTLGSLNVFGSIGTTGWISSIAVGGGSSLMGIVSLVILLIKNRPPRTQGIHGLLSTPPETNEALRLPDDENTPKKELSQVEREALEFARKTLEEHPEVKHTDFDWGRFARESLFDRDDKTPVNTDISKLTYIYDTIWAPKFKQIATSNSTDPWSRDEAVAIADAVLKLSCAIVYLTYDDMPALVQKLPKRHSEYFSLGCQYSYQYRWIVLHTRVYQMVRHASEDQQHTKRFYEEGTIQSQWRKLFNDHCVYEKNYSLGDVRYFSWFEQDTSENPLKELSPHTLPT